MGAKPRHKSRPRYGPVGRSRTGEGASCRVANCTRTSCLCGARLGSVDRSGLLWLGAAQFGTDVHSCVDTRRVSMAKNFSGDTAGMTKLLAQLLQATDMHQL